MSKRRKGDLLIFTGLLLVAAALFLTGYNLLENRRAQRNVDKVTEKIQEITVEVHPEYVINTDMELPVEEIDGMKYVGVLKMPTLQLELPVLSEGAAMDGNFLLAVIQAHLMQKIWCWRLIITRHIFRICETLNKVI